MGGASLLCGLALWATSLEAARRARYWLFYAVHHFGWLGFAVFGLMHYDRLVW